MGSRNRIDQSWAYLRFGPFISEAELSKQVEQLALRANQVFWAVRIKSTNKVCGWLSLCDPYPDDAAIEIGAIWFSPLIQRTKASTEAVFILMSLAFDRLGYRRLSWRCIADNNASLQAAIRYGFKPEGIWRSAALVKGCRVDIAWFSMLAEEWPKRRQAIEKWLSDENFDYARKAVSRLE